MHFCAVGLYNPGSIRSPEEDEIHKALGSKFQTSFKRSVRNF